MVLDELVIEQGEMGPFFYPKMKSYTCLNINFIIKDDSIFDLPFKFDFRKVCLRAGYSDFKIPKICDPKYLAIVDVVIVRTGFISNFSDYDIQILRIFDESSHGDGIPRYISFLKTVKMYLVEIKFENVMKDMDLSEAEIDHLIIKNFDVSYPECNIAYPKKINTFTGFRIEKNIPNCYGITILEDFAPANTRHVSYDFTNGYDKLLNFSLIPYQKGMTTNTIYDIKLCHIYGWVQCNVDKIYSQVELKICKRLDTSHDKTPFTINKKLNLEVLDKWLKKLHTYTIVKNSIPRTVEKLHLHKLKKWKYLETGKVLNTIILDKSDNFVNFEGVPDKIKHIKILKNNMIKSTYGLPYTIETVIVPDIRKLYFDRVYPFVVFKSLECSYEKRWQIESKVKPKYYRDRLYNSLVKGRWYKNKKKLIDIKLNFFN